MLQVIPISRLMLSHCARIGSAQLLRAACIPAMQLPILTYINNAKLSISIAVQSQRCLSHNPFNGDLEEERRAERELQRKLTQHGLKGEMYDFSTTSLQRAKMRLQSSASERHRKIAAEEEARRNYNA